VTHQGIQQDPQNDFVKKVTEEAEVEVEVEQPEVVEQSEPKAPGLVRCDICGGWCGPYARYEFFHGGRQFKCLRRKYGNRKRDRSRDSPVVSCRRLEASDNSCATFNTLFNGKTCA
jgi:hypothetical protein